MSTKKTTRLALLLILLAPLLAVSPAPASAQTAAPDPVLTYGQDQLPDRVRDFYLRTVGNEEAQKITNIGNAWYQNWAPDATKIAIVTEALQLFVMNPDGSDMTLLASGVYSNPFWSPDGRYIAYLGGEAWGAKPLARGDLWVVPSKGGAAWKVPGGSEIPSLPAGVAWSPDGTRIAAGFPGHIFDLTDPEAAPQDLPGQGAGMWVLGGGWSPDGRRMAVTDGNRWGILDIPSGQFTQVATSRGAAGTAKGGASWAANTRQVVFGISTAGADGQRVYVAAIDGSGSKLLWSQPQAPTNADKGQVTSIGPPNVDPTGRQALVRVTRNQRIDGKITYVHETWKLMLDGSENKLFIPYSFNAVWKPGVRFKSASQAFYNVWRQADNPVATNQVQRTWLWGPQPITNTMESWAGGQRLVEYYDKGRMEITDPNMERPSKYYVTSGLLVRELTTGQLQTGPESFEARTPANVLLAGDADDPGTATYATFNVLNAGTDAGKTDDHSGQNVVTTLLRDGTQGEDAGLGSGVLYAHYVAESGHNIPDAFWNWLQGQSDWVALMGYPISEPYWIYASIGGELKPVLVQLYERRTLTFNVANEPQWRVELGNVGQQYWNWRYGGQ